MNFWGVGLADLDLGVEAGGSFRRLLGVFGMPSPFSAS